MVRQRTTAPWRYAIGMLGTSIPISMIRGSAILFYVDTLGLDVRAYGTVMILYALIDAIDNPVLGHLSDRTRSRWGRRRPWLLIGAPLLVASFIAFFSPPEGLAGAELVLWFAIFAILCEAFDSLLNANYGALLPELFPQEKRRAVANGLRQGFQLIALVISLAVTPWLTTGVFGSETSTEGFATTATVYSALGLAVIWLMATGVRENPDHAAPYQPKFWSSIRVILTTALFWKVGLVGACYTISMGLVLSGVQLYVRYGLALPVAYALPLQAAVILVAAIGLATWTVLVRRWGALRVWRIGFIVLAASFALLFFANSLTTALIGGAILGVGWSGMLATNDLIIARVLDNDAQRHGEHREGLFLSAFGFFGRLNGAVTGLALASLALFFGYNSGGDPGADPGMAYRFYMCVYPLILCSIGAIAARLLQVPAPEPDAVAKVAD